MFDPLEAAGEGGVYLGRGDNGSWYSTSTSSMDTPPSSAKVGGGKLSDPDMDLKRLSSLWKTYHALIDEGANM